MELPKISYPVVDQGSNMLGLLITAKHIDALEQCYVM